MSSSQGQGGDGCTTCCWVEHATALQFPPPHQDHHQHQRLSARDLLVLYGVIILVFLCLKVADMALATPHHRTILEEEEEGGDDGGNAMGTGRPGFVVGRRGSGASDSTGSTHIDDQGGGASSLSSAASRVLAQ